MGLGRQGRDSLKWRLAETAARQNLLAGKPCGVVRSKEDRDGGDITPLADASKRGMGDRSRFKLRTDDAGAVRAFGLDHAWIQRVDADLFRAEFAGEHAGDGVDRALCASVNRTAWRCNAASDRTNIDNAATLAEVLHCGLRGENEAEHVNVENPVELVFGDRFDRRELVDPLIVDEDVETAIALDGGVDDTLRLRDLGDVTMHGNRFAAGGRDGSDNGVRACFA